MADNLVIGANGLIGRRIGAALSASGAGWTGTRHSRGEDSIVLDILDPLQVGEVIGSLCPKNVFHCANLAGGVNYCEANPEAARAFHLEATAAIGRACVEAGSRLVFISTDYVFDGTDGPYTEDDETNPVNLYGRLKREAENWLAEFMADSHITLRTTNVFGWDPHTATPNYMMSLYRTVTAGEVFRAPSFLSGNPTYAGDLADAAIELCDKKASGTYHIVGPTLIDRYEWAMKACKAFGLDHGSVEEVPDPPDGMVPRPLKSWLSTDKFTSGFATTLHDLDEGLALMADEMRSGR